MSDAALNFFLSSGTNAERLAFTPSPATPAAGPDPTYLWHETDTGDTYAWDFDGAAWNQVNNGAGALLPANNLSDVASASTARTNLGLEIGTDVQAYDADLSAFAGITGAQGDVLFYGASGWTKLGAGTAGYFLQTAGAGADPAWAAAAGAYTDEAARDAIGAALVAGTNITITVDDAGDTITIDAAGGGGGGDLLSTNNLSDLANVATARTNLGLAIGTDVQAYDADLGAIAGLTSAANKLPYFTGSGTAALADLSAAGRALIDDADAAAQRATLGVDTRPISFFFTTTPTTSEKLLIFVATQAFTLAANLSGSTVAVGTNPTATFALDLQRALAASPTSFSSIGTISISTSGTATLTTASGTSKSIAAGDVLRVVAPATVDATVADVAVSLKGTI